MLNPRESIEYHNRKYKFTFSGVDAGAEWVFDLTNPPNEFAFSDRYSQCLIQITKAHLTNRGDDVNFGLDSQFTGVVAGGQIPCETGVILQTDIRSNNKRQSHTGSQKGIPQLVGVYATLQSKYGAAGSTGNFGGVDHKNAALVKRGAAAAGDGGKGANDNLHNVNTWEYIDTRPIEDGGILCSNPFGKEFTCKLFDPQSEFQVKLTSAANFNVVASNGTALYLEMDVLMLPNPTPDDK